jgi:hypothetical protein
MTNQATKPKPKRRGGEDDEIVVTRGGMMPPFFFCPVCGCNMDTMTWKEQLLRLNPKGFKDVYWVCKKCGKNPDKIPQRMREHATWLSEAADRQHLSDDECSE